MISARTHIRRPLRLGFIALVDAAPLIMARELGLFAARGLDVVLSREVGWATVRDKIVYGELDAGHALAGMLVSTQLGLGCPASDVFTACVLNLNGNAITISRALADSGVRDAAALRFELRRRHGERKLTLGVVFPWSSHHLMMREWLRAGGIDPDREVRTVVVPPAQMFRNLSAGTIDGFCAGEPWNSLAVRDGVGRVVTWSATHEDAQIEKVLMARSSIIANRPEEHFALINALVEACAWCDEPGNRPGLARLLARPEYLNVPEAVLTPSLIGPFDCGDGATVNIPDFVIFSRHDANAPTPVRGAEIIRRMAGSGLIPAEAAHDSTLPRRLFREDLYKHAISNYTHEIESV